MEVMFILIGLSLFIGTIFLGAFIWAVKTGQFDDCHTPAIKMLFEDKSQEVSVKNKGKETL